MCLLSMQLILRSINSTKSAYASVSFDYPFFDAYELLEANVVQAGLTMKANCSLCPLNCLQQLLSCLRLDDLSSIAC